MSWETVIGLEVHIELSTESKIFCSCTTAFGGAPNTHCCPICTGMPGTLPRLNRKVLEYAVKAGVALGCEITRQGRFDRKNYFYPDLPKAYQISQLYLPFAREGAVKISLPCQEKVIRIHEIHMEEDAGKLIHSADGAVSCLDYNRSGVPLLEIVTEPDFRSADEVTEFLTKLKGILEYLEISDGKMQEGSLRADVNLSVRRTGEKILGTRTEMKNLNSFRNIERAIAYEADRQIALIESGERVVQQTRRWDEESGTTLGMRTKEDARDYRYFPDPDLPPVYIDDALLDRVRAEQPEFAEERAACYVREFSLTPADARIITSIKAMADLFEQAAAKGARPKEIRYWLVGEALYYMGERGLDFPQLYLSAEKLAQLASLVTDGHINRPAGKKVFASLIDSGGSLDIDTYIAENDLLQVEDISLIREAVIAVFAENPHSVAQYRAGKTKVAAFLVGQSMKRLRGKGKPETVNKIVYELLQ